MMDGMISSRENVRQNFKILNSTRWCLIRKLDINRTEVHYYKKKHVKLFNTTVIPNRIYEFRNFIYLRIY